RLQLALDKLQAPRRNDADEVPLAHWWHGLRERYASADIDFEAGIEDDVWIPEEVFDTVAENLLENARYKRLSEPGIRIRARLRSDASGVRLEVHDSGSPIPARTAALLFESVVESRTGLGIGLHQASRAARAHGYRLSLTENRRGVGFELSSAGSEPKPVRGGS
ncbi:MAG: sensor histidine kinase, partial [Gammaproteobacteria bacterium]|nr:sensor histidine kinase [Gammaproteobacteria bacterium]